MKTTNLPLLNYRVNLQCPSPTKKHKRKEEEITSTAHAEKGNLRVQQERIPEKWQGPISCVQSRIRNLFDKNCFRLNDTYALPISQYETFEAQLAKMVDEHTVHVEALCRAIETGEIVTEAMRRAGNEFNPNFLPSSCEAVRSAIRVNITRIADLSNPAISKALSDLAETTRTEVEARIKADAEKAEADGQTSVVGFVMDEITDYLKDVSTRCADDGKGKHFQTLLDKFIRITEKLPSYNVTNNPQISNAIAKIYDTFKSLDKKELAKDSALRKETSEKAKTLLVDLTASPLF